MVSWTWRPPARAAKREDAIVFDMPTSLDDIETPEALRPRIARRLGLPLAWDVAVDALPRPALSGGIASWAATLCRLYRHVRPRRIGDRCAFEPSCSRYAELGFRAYGLREGARLAIDRLRRCEATAGGLDLPPGFCGCSSRLEKKIDEIQSRKHRGRLLG